MRFNYFSRFSQLASSLPSFFFYSPLSFSQPPFLLQKAPFSVGKFLSNNTKEGGFSGNPKGEKKIEPLLWKNGTLVPSSKSVNHLLSSSHGAFTTCRTFDGKAVVMLDFHLHRMVHSHDPENKLSEAEGKALMSLMESQIANALSLYRERNGGTEMGLTLLLAKKGLEKKEETKESKEVREPLQDEDFYIAVSGLKEIPEVVIVELRLAERANPHLKTTDWVKERNKDHLSFTDPIHEVVLLNDEGYIFEGTSSNVVVHKEEEKQILMRPPKGTVLEGTMVRLVEGVCKKSDVPFLYNPLSLSHLREWKGLALTSTSRGLLPVHYVRVPLPAAKNLGLLESQEGIEKEENGMIHFKMPASPFLAELRQKVEDAIQESSRIPKTEEFYKKRGGLNFESSKSEVK